MSSNLIRRAQLTQNCDNNHSLKAKQKEAVELRQQIEFAELAAIKLITVEAEIEFYKSRLIDIPPEEEESSDEEETSEEES